MEYFAFLGVIALVGIMFALYSVADAIKGFTAEYRWQSNENRVELHRNKTPNKSPYASTTSYGSTRIPVQYGE